MKIHRYLFLIILILSLLFFRTYVSAEVSGKTGLNFLKIGVGARPAGLGESFVAVADETSGIFWNPAGAGFFISPELQAMHCLWLDDIYYTYIGYSYPSIKGTFVGGIQYLSGPSTAKIVEGTKQGSFSFYDSALNLAYSIRTAETSSIGFTIRGIQSVLDTDQKTTLTGDFGFLYRTRNEVFSFGFSGQNLFGSIGEDKMPISGKIGIGLKTELPQHFSDILFSFEVGKTEGEPLYCATGIEHWGAKTLGIRFGYKYIDDKRLQDSLDTFSSWRLGLSLRLKDIALDYAYHPFAALGAAHRISLTWRMFGWVSKTKIVPANLKTEPIIFSPNNDGVQDNIFFIPQIGDDIKSIKNWELIIETKDHILVKKMTGKDVLPKILSWQGQKEDNTFINEDTYLVSFIAEGSNRIKAKSEYVKIIADLTPPEVSLKISSNVFSPDGDGLDDSISIDIFTKDQNGIDYWQLDILNERKKIIKTFKSTDTASLVLIWDGYDDFYGKVVPNGRYLLRLTSWDKAGNRTITDKDVQVYIAPKVEVREIVKEIQIKEEKRGLVVNLSSRILFDVGKSLIKPEAYSALDEVVNLLKTYPENDVLIEGHTDSTGSRKKNIELSSARAWAIYSYLVRNGISPSRLKPKGYGPDKPVASNSTSSGREKNRRVDIIILKK